jgi:hypothetical protein
VRFLELAGALFGADDRERHRESFAAQARHRLEQVENALPPPHLAHVQDAHRRLAPRLARELRAALEHLVQQRRRADRDRAAEAVRLEHPAPRLAQNQHGVELREARAHHARDEPATRDHVTDVARVLVPDHECAASARESGEHEIAQHPRQRARHRHVDHIGAEARHGAQQPAPVRERPHHVRRIEVALERLRAPLGGVAVGDLEGIQLGRLEHGLCERLHPADGRRQRSDDEQARLAAFRRHLASRQGSATARLRLRPDASRRATRSS